MTRPHIGITTSYENGKQALDIHYIRAVETAGGLPVIVPILESDEAAAQFTALLDGLVIPGGPGITRGLIGHLPDEEKPVKGKDAIETLWSVMLQVRKSYGVNFAFTESPGFPASSPAVAANGSAPHGLTTDQLRNAIGDDGFGDEEEA